MLLTEVAAPTSRWARFGVRAADRLVARVVRAEGHALRRLSEIFRGAPQTVDEGGVDGMIRSDPGVRVTSGLRQFIVYTNQPEDEARSMSATDVWLVGPKPRTARNRRSSTPQSLESPRLRRPPTDRSGST